MFNRYRLTQRLALVCAALCVLVAYGCRVQERSASCPAAYLQANRSGANVFFVVCKADLISMSPSEKEKISRELMESIQGDRGVQSISVGRPNSAVCVSRSDSLQVFDEDSPVSCILVRGRTASAVLFGSRRAIQSLSAEDITRVTTTMDGIIEEEGLRLLNRGGSPEFKASAVASLNADIGRPIFDDLSLGSYSVSEPVP